MFAQPYPQPIKSAQLKTVPSDFIVHENMHITLDQTGEHLWLQIQKTNLNTQFVVRLLAQWANIAPKDVGYSGLKDRHAQTCQWFSLRLPNKISPEMSFEQFAQDKLNDDEQICVLQSVWHGRKLNRGTHKSNQFIITLRQIDGDVGKIDDTLQQIKTNGVPNYFGEQRFGNDASNIAKTQEFFAKICQKGRYFANKKFAERDGLWISTARSVLFNQMLSVRVSQENWHTALSGDVFNLDGTGAIFIDDGDEQLAKRLQTGDIHPTAPLFGIGEPKTTSQAHQLYQAILEQPDNAIFVAGLNLVKANLAYRPLRLMVRDLAWQFDNQTLTLSFSLPKGSFATVVLSALVQDLQNQASLHIKTEQTE